MEQSITFTGELDERSIDREVGQLNNRLQEAGEIDVNATGGGATAIGPQSVGAREQDTSAAELAGGAGGLAEAFRGRMPKSISAAGGMASAAMPVALAGGVGFGMLSAMKQSSAALQTSSSMLSNAWNTVWRPIGDELDQLFIRDIAMGIMDTARDFESAFRAGFQGDILPQNLEQISQRFQALEEFGALLPGLPGMIANKMGTALSTAFDPDGPIFGINWTEQVPDFPGWPDVGGMWNQMGGWPSVNAEWSGWPAVRTEWGGWPSVQTEWDGWPDLSVPSNFWPDLSLPDGFWPSLDPRDVIDELTGGRGGGDDGDDDSGFLGGLAGRDEPVFGYRSGGRVARSGRAVVHRNEIIADPDRLVSELAGAVSDTGGGGTTTVDMSGLERKLDTLIREVKRSGGDGEASIRIGEREFAKLVGDAQSNTTTSTDRLS